MGTRNLTMVISEGKTRIAQYGQWDGYPEGQGLTALLFLLSANLEHFKTQLRKCRFITKWKQNEINKFLKSIGSNDGWMTMEQAAKYNEKYPLLSRNHGAEIMELIDKAEGRIFWVHDSTYFAGDSLFCEWAYVIDLDKRTFEVYEGFNETPLDETERFYFLVKESSEYYPVKHLKTYSLDELPTQEVFLAEMKELLKSEEEEEEEKEE